MKLRNLIRLCMNDEYTKANVKVEEERKVRRNGKAVFSDHGRPFTPKSSIMTKSQNVDDFEVFDEVGLAFRKSALTALNQDKILFKRIDM